MPKSIPPNGSMDGSAAMIIVPENYYFVKMPSISSFLGITIYMYWRDHSPPHFHAKYGEHEVLIDINELEVFEGALPRRALGHVLEWANEHQQELMENWERCRKREHPKSISPLE